MSSRGTIDFSDPRVRSGLHFIVFLVVAGAVTGFILKKAQEAIVEIQKMSELPAIQIRRDFELR